MNRGDHPSTTARALGSIVTWKALAGFAHRLAYAGVLAGATWFIVVFPLDLPDTGLLIRLTRLANFPVSLVGRLLPPELRGIDLFVEPFWLHNMPVQDMLLRHLRVAVPVYVLVLYMPNLLIWFARKLREGRESRPAPR